MIVTDLEKYKNLLSKHVGLYVLRLVKSHEYDVFPVFHISYRHKYMFAKPMIISNHPKQD